GGGGGCGAWGGTRGGPAGGRTVEARAASDLFLGLGKRPVGDHAPAVADANRRGGRGGPQPRADLQPVAELPEQRVESCGPGRVRTRDGVLVVTNQQGVSHRASSCAGP